MSNSPFSSVGIPTSLGTMVVHRMGDVGDWVVCWPTIMSDHRGMLEFATLLSAHHRIVLIDPPGFFANQKIAVWPGLFNMAELALGLCDALGAREFHWVGHGFGGHVGAALLSTQPHRVKTITLSSVPLVEPARVSVFKRLVAQLLYRNAWGRKIVAQKMCEQMVLHGSEERHKIERFVNTSLQACNVRVLSALGPTPGHQTAELLRVLRSCEVPKLVIAGDRDNFSLARDQKTAAELMPRTRYAELSCGFMTFLMRPEQCAAAFSSFLRTLK